MPGTRRLVPGTAAAERQVAIETVQIAPVGSRFPTGGTVVPPGCRRRNVGQPARNFAVLRAVWLLEYGPVPMVSPTAQMIAGDSR